MKDYFSSHRAGPLSATVAIVTSVFFIVGIAQAVTTISTNISTGGSLTVNSTTATSSIAWGTTLASSGGFVGVGFTTPLSILNIKASNPVLTITDSRDQSYTVGDQMSAIDFASDDTSSGGFTGKVRARIAALELDTFGASQGLAFYTTRITNGIVNQQLLLTDTGDLILSRDNLFHGLGESAGSGQADFTITGTGGSGSGNLQLASANTTGDNGQSLGSIEWHNESVGTTTANSRSAYINVTNSGTAGTNIGSYMTFATEADGTGSSNAGTERMRITNQGNVGIGTTTPATRLQVSNGASATTTVTIGELGLTSSKGCVNMNQADGSAGSFYLAGGVLKVETNYCR